MLRSEAMVRGGIEGEFGGNWGRRDVGAGEAVYCASPGGAFLVITSVICKVRIPRILLILIFVRRSDIGRHVFQAGQLPQSTRNSIRKLNYCLDYLAILFSVCCVTRNTHISSLAAFGVWPHSLWAYHRHAVSREYSQPLAVIPRLVKSSSDSAFVVPVSDLHY